MKKANLVVFQEDKEALFKSLQRHAVLMVISQGENIINSDNQTEEVLLQRAKKTLTTMKNFREEKPKFGDVTIVDVKDFEKENDEALKVIEDMEHQEELINSAKASIATIKEELKTLTPWLGMPFMLNELNNTKYASVHIGYIDIRKVELFKEKMDEFDCIYELYDKSRLGQTVCYFAFKDDEKALSDFIKEVGYTDANLPVLNKTMAGLIEEKNEEIKKKEQQIENSKKRIIELSNESQKIEIFNDQLLSQKVLKKVDYANTMDTTFVSGWVREDQVDLLKQAIDEATDLYDLEILDPASDEVPPTYTKNNKVVSQFEGITDMFSKPNYHEADPNPVMSFWYWILFGMMVGDVGYGILLLIATTLFIKLAKPKGGTKKLAKIICYSSITTIFWGIVFNSIFGATIFGEGGFISGDFFLAKISFAPLDNAITMMIVSVAVGALHILSGLVVKAIANIKNKQYLDMLGGQASWFLVIIGLAIYAASMFVDSLKSLGKIGLIITIAGASLVVLFKGHDKKGIFGKLFKGVLGLYDITAYMSDLLSYTRIMALVMSSAAVAMVMNTLAGMVQGNVIGYAMSFLIYIVGHIFNLVLGLLSAYVHDSRLQYIEFFGKFYEGGGYDFKPLSFETKYIYEIKQN